MLVWVGGLQGNGLRKEDRKLANRVCRGDFRTRAQHRMHQEANCSHGGSVCSVHSCVPGTWNSNSPFCVYRLAQHARYT